MTTIEVTLPDALAQEVASAGLLAPATIERILREQLRKNRIERMSETRATLASQPLKPMTPAEIDAEIMLTALCNRVRLVLDTNTAISGLLWGRQAGKPDRVGRGWPHRVGQQHGAPG